MTRRLIRLIAVYGVLSLTFFIAAAARAQVSAVDTLDGEALVQFAREAVDNQGWKDVSDAIKKYVSKNRPTAEQMVWLGKAGLFLNDNREAERSFKRAIDLDKKSADAWEGLIELYMVREREKDVLNSLKNLRETEGESRRVRYWTALAADKFKNKQYDDGYFWDTLENLVREDIDDDRTLNTLCDAYIQDRFHERGILFLTEMSDMNHEKPEFLFQLARIYTHSGDKELARDIFFRIEEASLDSLTPRQRFLMAKELFRLGEDALACLAYFSAAREMDDALAEDALGDIRDITTSEERREFRLTPSGRKGLFLISFWTRKDPTPTTVKNERLIEHYKRMEEVKDKFYSPLRPGYDERGRVYIKHGEPDQKIGLSGNWAIRDNETWLYSKNRSQPLLYNFVARNNFYRMVYRLEEALIPDLQTEINMGGSNIVELFRSRGEIHPKYDQLANELHNFRGNIETARRTSLMDLFADEEMLTERGFTEGEVTETFEFKFEEDPMNFYYYPAALKGSDSLSTMGIFFALPTDQIKLPDPFGAVDIPVELEVVVYDSWWQEVARNTQSKTYRVNNFVASKDQMIPDLMGLNLKPGNYHLAVRMKQLKSNLMQIYKSTYFVPSFRSQDSLYISDLILAADVQEDNAPGKFTIRGHRITPMPSSSFKTDQPVFIYYELYNVRPDSSGTKHIRVEYSVSSTSGDLSVAQKLIRTLGRLVGMRDEIGKVVSIFERDWERPGNIDPIYLSIDPASYPPGRYNVMVTVMDTVGGSQVARDATFLIQK